MSALAFGCMLFAVAFRSADNAGAPPVSKPGPEWGMEAGYGLMAHVNRGRSDETLLLFAPSVAFPMGSRFDYAIEGHFARYLTPRGYMIGLMPLGARYRIGSSATRPYVSGGAGFGWTDLLQLQEIDRRFNFLLQASVGVRGPLSGPGTWTLEVRLNHISNSNTAGENLGLNTVVFLAGWRFR